MAKIMKRAGYPARELRVAGYSIDNLLGAGYSVAQVAGAGYRSEQLAQYSVFTEDVLLAAINRGGDKITTMGGATNPPSTEGVYSCLPRQTCCAHARPMGRTFAQPKHTRMLWLGGSLCEHMLCHLN